MVKSLRYLNDSGLRPLNYQMDPAQLMDGSLTQQDTGSNIDQSVAWCIENIRIPIRFCIQVQPIIRPWQAFEPYTR